MPLGMEVGLSPGDFVLDGDPIASPQKGRSPQFSAHVHCGQTAAWIKMPLGAEDGFGLHDIVLDGDPASPDLNGHSPQFSANVRCGQTAGWTKTPLGMDCVRWGPSYQQKKGHTHPRTIFAHVYCDQTARWIMMPLGTEINIGLGDVVLDVVAAPPKRGTAPSFRFVSTVAKRLDG